MSTQLTLFSLFKLVVFTPKSLLRHPSCKSSFDELLPGTEFKRVLPDDAEQIKSQPEAVKRQIFCTGKVYYELIKERNARGLDDKVAITRIEQLCPFPFDLVRDEIQKYPNADVMWSQEEHKNQGWFNFIEPNIECVLRHLNKETMRVL